MAPVRLPILALLLAALPATAAAQADGGAAPDAGPPERLAADLPAAHPIAPIELPPQSPAATPAPPAVPEAPPPLLDPTQVTVVTTRKPISAASSFSVRDRDFALRPIGSVQDILRVTPGLVLVQHSGGGKANQYFLRGFDADHGTDLALSIDGMPDQHGVARARPGLRRHQLHHPRGGRARARSPRARTSPTRATLATVGRGQHGVARRLRAQLRGRLGWSARPATAPPATAALRDRQPEVRQRRQGDLRRRDRPRRTARSTTRSAGTATSCSTS